MLHRNFTALGTQSALFLLIGCGAAPLSTASPDAAARALPAAFCADATPAARAALLRRLPRPLSVEPATRDATLTKFAPRQVPAGATLVLPAPEGMSPPWLERTLTCHQADVALGGIAATPDDPVVQPNNWLSVHVRAEGGTLVVRLETSDPDQAVRVLDQARRWAHREAVAGDAH